MQASESILQFLGKLRIMIHHGLHVDVKAHAASTVAEKMVEPKKLMSTCQSWPVALDEASKPYCPGTSVKKSFLTWRQHKTTGSRVSVSVCNVVTNPCTSAKYSCVFKYIKDRRKPRNEPAPTLKTWWHSKSQVVQSWEWSPCRMLQYPAFHKADRRKQHGWGLQWLCSTKAQVMAF